MDNYDQSNEIINEQQKEIERLNQALKEKDFEISNLIKEKNFKRNKKYRRPK